MGDSVESLPEVYVDNIHCSPLIYQASHFIIEVFQDPQLHHLMVTAAMAAFDLHIPNDPFLPVHKPNSTWCLTVDYHKLNENTGRLHAAVPSITDLVFTIEQAAHPWMAVLDVKDTLFMVPLQPEDQERFAFTQGGTQYAFTRLPQGFKHSPTLSHQALAREIEQVPQEPGMIVYQYIDDILIGGDSLNKV
ncbi:hypothetical protein QYF61_016341 [Mycteria americana]|uniref:ribonuclease H n=1 Tax=Mycteria americana TaxID=33587 RepID=A0AAN7RPQ1_MYCAM|nr:hypothetical protein QYF61_016341 [Mycteria americana]